jgi:hypothetical protein
LPQGCGGSSLKATDVIKSARHVAGQTDEENKAEFEAKIAAEKAKLAQEKARRDKENEGKPGFLDTHLQKPLAVTTEILNKPAALEVQVREELKKREAAKPTPMTQAEYEALATSTVNATIAQHAVNFKKAHPELTSDEELNAQLEADLNKQLPGGNKDAAIKHLTGVISSEAQQANSLAQAKAAAATSAVSANAPTTTTATTTTATASAPAANATVAAKA